VVLDRKRFVPEDSGRLVTAFLESYFHRYVEYDFTADLEGRLDSVSAGEVDWKVVLRDFWRDFSNAVEGTSELRVREVLDKVNDMLAPHLYPDGGADRICPACKKGSLNLRGGRNGFFLGCDAYPECHYTRAMKQAEEGDADEMFAAGPIALGDDPESQMPLTLRSWARRSKGIKRRRASRNVPACPPMSRLSNWTWIWPSKSSNCPGSWEITPRPVNRSSPVLAVLAPM
jgi:DNA topoisomerase-1